MGLILYNRDSLPRARPSDFPVFECYLEEGRRKLFACNLITFGSSIFKRAAVIRKLDLIVAMHRSGEAKNVEVVKVKLDDVLLDSLVDNIRISVCFENYFKAKLLLNDVLVHSIDHNKDKALSKEQRARPIAVSEIISQRTVKEMAILNDLLKEQTINYSTILEVPEYVKLLNMPSATLEFLQQQNSHRNKLHLHIGETFLLSDNIVQQYQELVTIVDRDMALLQNSLIDLLDSGSPSRLPVHV